MARRQGHHYWRDSKTEGLLHDGLFEYDGLETAKSVFENEEDADNFLESLAGQYPEQKDRLQSAAQYKDGKKVKEGADLLTEQGGLDDYLADGGQRFLSDREFEAVLDELHDLNHALDYHQGDQEKVAEIEAEKQEIKESLPSNQIERYM